MAHITIAAIGGGGKTTALKALAQQAPGAVLVTTTTHIYPLTADACRLCLTDPSHAELTAALSLPGILCAGSSAPEGKLGALSPEVLAQGMECAHVVLYEGDGSRRLPLKLHRPGEPVLLPGTDRVLVVAGLSALGRPVDEVVHRYDRREIWKNQPHRPVGAEELVHCVLETVSASQFPKEKIKVLLNQADMVDDPRELVELIVAQGLDCRAASLERDSSFLWDWLTAT